jgi:hypothetical protein
MGLGVFQSQGRAPRPTQYARPLLDTQVGAQCLNIGYEERGLVGDGRTLRTRLAAASLVVEDHSVVIRIEEAGVPPRTASARPSVQKEGRRAVPVAVFLPVDLISAKSGRNQQHAG